MSIHFHDFSPRQIVGVSRGLIVLAVMLGVGCLEAVRHPLARHPLPLHMLTQTGAAAMLAAFAAAVALAGYAAYWDIDAPSRYRAKRR